MPPCLGDLFPDEFKSDFAGRAISPKNIIVISVPDFNLDYEKYMVLITSSVDNVYMGCVSINTNPSPKNNHVIISTKNHDFLRFDSHMSCSSIVPLRIDYITEILKKEPERIKGEITDDQHVEIIQKLKVSSGISPIIKEQFNL